MNVIFIGDNRSNHFLKWIEPLKEIGIDVFYAPSNVHKTDGTVKYKILVLYFLHVITILYKRRIDIIHLHYVGVYSLPALALSYVFGKPLIVSVWGSDINFMDNRLINKIKLLVLNHAKYIICDADHIRLKMEAFGVSPAKFRHIEFGIDFDTFGTVDNINSSEVSVDNIKLYVNRRHEQIYQNQIVIDFFELLQERYPSAQLLIAGSGKETNNYIEAISSKNINNVQFLGSFNSLELINHFNRSNIYMSASQYDAGLATSVAEAMSAGLLCIVPDILDNSRYARHLDTAILFDHNRLDKLLMDLIYVLETNLYDRIRLQGKKIIHENLSLDNCVKELREVYHEVC